MIVLGFPRTPQSNLFVQIGNAFFDKLCFSIDEYVVVRYLASAAVSSGLLCAAPNIEAQTQAKDKIAQRKFQRFANLRIVLLF